MGVVVFWGDGLKEEVKRLKIRGHRGGGNIHLFNCLKINLFSVFSVVGF